MVKIEDVANAAGVSKSTVSNVFSEKRPISKEVRERVLAVAKQLNYRPNYWARSLAMKETRIIGLNMPAEEVKFSQFHLSLINGVLEECYKQGYRLLVNTLSKDYKSKIEFQTSDPVDGEILLDPEVGDSRIEERIQQNVPLVVIGKPPKPYEDRLAYVDNNNVTAAEDIANHLLEIGHTSILFLNAPSSRTVSQDRASGFVQALQKNGIDSPDDFMVCKEKNMRSKEFGYNQTIQKLKQRKQITAVITDNIKMASGVYRAAEEMGYTIPNDLSVISFSDDSMYGSEFSPPLSSIQLNGEMLGSESAKLLIEQIHTDQPVIKRIIVPTQYNERESIKKWIGKQGG